MFIPGTHGTHFNFDCVTTSHQMVGGSGITYQLLQYISAAPPWSWQGDSRDTQMKTYGLNPMGWYYWYPILTRDGLPYYNSNPFIPGPPPTVRSTTRAYSCTRCGIHNEYITEPNLTKDRYLCFSCKSTYSWAYSGEFI